jgi:hypothetical protein
MYQQTINKQVNNVRTKIMQKKKEKFGKLKMDEMDEEEHLHFIFMILNVDSEKSPSKLDKQPTWDNTELNSNEGIYKVMR